MMALPGGVMRVADPEGVWVFSVKTGRDAPRDHGMCVFVDDESEASRVDVLLDASDRVSQLTSVAGYELPPVRGVAEGDFTVADELGLILDGYDHPFARLAAAIKLVYNAQNAVPPERNAAVNQHRTRRIGEWMRGLGLSMSAADGLTMASRLGDRLAESAAPGVDPLAVALAAEILGVARLHTLAEDPAPGLE
jgi:hypothetical protein